MPSNLEPLSIDIVSDVVCPWCVIGCKHLERALADLDEVTVTLRWRPFELNPGMPPEGQNLREHLAQKYGTTPEGSRAARAKLKAMGAEVGFAFHHFESMRIWNTFRAHQLSHWAATHGRQTELELALFEAYFSHQQNVDDPTALAEAAAQAGLDRHEATTILETQPDAEAVRVEQRRWLEAGITAVPAVVFDGRFVVMGAQDSAIYRQVIERVLDGRAKATSRAGLATDPRLGAG